MKNSRKADCSTANGHVTNGPSNTIGLDSADIHACVAAADVVRAVDPELGGGTVFYGRSMLEEVIRTGIPRSAKTLEVTVDFGSDEPEQLERLVRQVKGGSCFRPADIFPEFDIDAASFSSAEDLLPPVRRAVEGLRTEHRTLLPLLQRRFYYCVRAHGFAEAHEPLREGMRLAKEMGSTDTPQAYVTILRTLGELLYQRLPRELILPTRCLDIIHRFGKDDHNLELFCRSLMVKQTSKGPAYFSRRMPRMRFHGINGDRLVAFKEHALERICERTVYDWRTYGGHGDAFAFLDNCVYFEDCTAVRGEPSFVVYNSCVPHFTSWEYVAHVLENPVPSHQYYYRVGYCPVNFFGDIARAETLLVPGMNKQQGTPEGRLIDQSGLSAAEVARKRNQVERQLSMKALVDGNDYSLIKWFHENGVPQVVQLHHDVFKYDVETPLGRQEIGDGGRTFDLGF